MKLHILTIWFLAIINSGADYIFDRLTPHMFQGYFGLALSCSACALIYWLIDHLEWKS